MNNHQKAFETMNEAIKILATSSDELQYRLSVACRDFIGKLYKNDFSVALYNNFNLLSKKLHLNNDDFQQYFLDIDENEASRLALSIFEFHLQVCEEYFSPGSY
ncbi:hypothetical protein [Desulfuromonas sp. AOP6]|uniref:hypothetical protein n=1 Tax=Desulfuromonas sp. AOP6 TaxID=1566351 RepID=UPI00127F2DF7|nr:hypothetical protein [Desulfuromonas sp. AOP6]BCA78570.1 hypothetical protein AOP6_0357 [Desulfuromonas sp. AOP6]